MQERTWDMKWNQYLPTFPPTLLTSLFAKAEITTNFLLLFSLVQAMFIRIYFFSKLNNSINNLEQQLLTLTLHKLFKNEERIKIFLSFRFFLLIQRTESDNLNLFFFQLFLIFRRIKNMYLNSQTRNKHKIWLCS